MLKIAVALALFITAVGPAVADTCAQNPKQVADNAVKLLSFLPTVQSFCDPCGDKVAQRLPVRQPVAVKNDDDDGYRVVVNDATLDLAYIFVPKSSTSDVWVNLGLVVRCAAPSAIPIAQLPGALVAR